MYPTRFFTLFLALLLGSTACGGGADGSDPGGDGTGDADGGVVPCEPTGPEEVDGRDNDCDGLTDEVQVCADGAAPYATLAAGVAAAPEGGGLEVCAGTYEERLDIAGKSVHIRAIDGAATTIIDANAGGPAIIVRGGAAGGVTIEGFTIREGGGVRGGALRCEGSTLGVKDAVLIGNRANQGGGLYASACEIHVSGTRFEGNSAPGQGGGAVLLQSTGEIVASEFVDNQADKGGAVAIVDGEIAIRDSEFRQNLAAVNGGALFVDSDLALEGSTFTNNRSDFTGGAIYVFEHAPTLADNVMRDNSAFLEGGAAYFHFSSAVLTDNTISGNSCGDDGGGLRLFTSTMRLERNMITNNTAVKNGGGLKSSHMQNVFVDNVIKDNTARSGGGLELDNDSSIVRGGVISGNVATSLGGGIHASLFPWSGAAFEDVVIENNRAATGGGLWLGENFEPIAMRGVTVKNNTAERGGGVFVRATPLTMTRTLIRGNHATSGGGGLFVAALDQMATGCGMNGCPNDPVAVGFNVIYDNDAPSGAGVYGEYAPLTVSNSIVVANTGPSSVFTTVAPTWRYNNTRQATFGGAMTNPTGSNGNISSEPKFMSPTSGDFHLQGSSPCVDAGDPSMTDSDGTPADLGLYGGP